MKQLKIRAGNKIVHQKNHYDISTKSLASFMTSTERQFSNENSPLKASPRADILLKGTRSFQKNLLADTLENKPSRYRWGYPGRPNFGAAGIGEVADGDQQTNLQDL